MPKKKTTSKKSTKKSKKMRINPWMVTSIILIILLGGFIAYDKSTGFQNFVNDTFGIETGPGKIGLTIVTDPFVDNPPYDVEENMEELQTEIEREFKIKTADINEEEGQKLLEEYNLKTVPVLIFDDKITETDFYEEASAFFTKEGDSYLVKLQPFKYLEYPTTDDAQYKGANPEDAQVTIIEYSSFTCPYCAKMSPILDQIVEEYPDQVSYIYKHFDRGGSDAIISNASECAGDQGKFWEMHDYIMNNQDQLREMEVLDFINAGVTELELEPTSFETCMQGNDYAERIQSHTMEGHEFGVTGTPGFFVNETYIGGAVDYEQFKAAVDQYIQ